MEANYRLFFCAAVGQSLVKPVKALIDAENNNKIVNLFHVRAACLSLYIYELKSRLSNSMDLDLDYHSGNTSNIA